ncbi:MAG: hypothetical protein HY863_22030 [Chloroflexi bacterium]|nr:hypothetical protein [Chloroflexota bacterium]
MKWIIIILVTLSAAWMLADGLRALTIGDYFTPSGGEYAGQLGPWTILVQALGIEPRSTFMKIVFVVYGIAALIAVAGFAINQSWGRNILFVVAILGLWYLPIGTATNIAAVILLFLNRRNHAVTTAL